jgi:hypothetical protein
MATILRGFDDSNLAISQHLYVKGDDDGLWYEVGFSLDPVFGIYMWGTPNLVDTPHGTRNISDGILGAAIWIADPLGTWHQMTMTLADPTVQGYSWTDYNQTTSTPSVGRRTPHARADDGIYLIDSDGNQIHKMGVTGGRWAELNQGYSLPL